MTKFDCTWCGKCCESFGEFIKIERQLSSQDYYCRFGITNEIFPVHVQPEFADAIDEEYSEQDIAPTNTAHKGCIFMRENPAGKGFACAIYPTWPEICRDFKCYRMLIHRPKYGEVHGRVIGINELRTKDEDLVKIWADIIANLPHPFTERKTPSLKNYQSVHGHESHIEAHLYDIMHTDDHEWLANVITVLQDHGYHGDPVD